jgi:uncharacterized phage protein gp47/JayE
MGELAIPWYTPTLKQVRQMNRDNVTAFLSGAMLVPNSVLRVMSDAMAGLARLVLEYIDWLSLQLLPDTAETEWLDRHGQIWLVNSDGTIGRKQATLAEGTVNATGTIGAIIPNATTLTSGVDQVQYEVTAQTFVSDGPTPVPVRALDGGAVSNRSPGDILSFDTLLTDVDGETVVVSVDGGADPETDDQLRARVLLRIQQPPMGGDAKDYVQWTLAVPGVTRAWSYPNEMGIGTVTVRFMMDDLRASAGGFPTADDIAAVTEYLATVRPVAIKDFFVVAPIAYPIDHHISNLQPDTAATHAGAQDRLLVAFLTQAIPGSTWYREWSSTAIASATGITAFDLSLTLPRTSTDMPHVPMPYPGYMPVLGNLFFVDSLVPAPAPAPQ